MTMSSRTCDSVTEVLVPYADSELPEADAAAVAAHLAVCPECRAELRLLKRSLELARQAWRESARDAPVPAGCPLQPRRRRLQVAVGLAACVAVLLAAAGWWRFSGEPPDGSVPRIAEIEPAAPPAPVAPPAPAEEIDLVELIAREGRSARLAAAARLLAAQPGLESYQDQAERYLLETYPDTTAAAGAADGTFASPTEEPES